jgi:hypothetical protein
MRSRGIALALLWLTLLLPLYFVVHKSSWRQQAEVRRSMHAGYVMPSSFSRILAFGYQGLLSDYQFLKTMSFVGDRAVAEQRLSVEDWDYLVASLDAVTDLDPYFLDPYILGQGLLTWEAGRVEDANQLLEKGIEHRSNDWLLRFYAGFNHFYFLKDNVKGGEYIMGAARKEGSPSFLPTLAGRLSYYGGQSKTGLLFLRELLADSNDPRMRARLEMRLTALERAVMLEEKLATFQKEQGRAAQSLDELVRAGYLDQLPPDPYGGQWIILKSGRVFSTSRFVPVEKK